MKYILASFLLLFAAITGRADVTINLGFGDLYFADDTTFAPVGSLVQLVASSTDNIFTSPTATSFTGDSSDDVILASFPVNDPVNDPGEFTAAITLTYSGTLNPGDQILLRWFPSLDSSATAPGAGTQYGQFRTDLVETENGSDTAWVLPGNGDTISLNLLTIAAGGTRPESDGAANLMIVPEPSTSALLIAALGCAAFVRFRVRRSS